MMRKSLLFAVLAVGVFATRASAGTVFGALSNFDAVNDTGSPCNGFEIELDDVRSKDVTYTFQYQRYGVPKISEDTVLIGGVAHPRTFVRWMSPYDQVAHVFTKATLVAPPGFANTGGHLCFGSNVVNGTPYDTAGCEHFGVGTLINPSSTVYRWMKEDPSTPGSLLAQGSPVTIPAPVWTVNAGAVPVVAAVIPVPPPPAVVPVPYLPNAEFGVAVWAKVFETESEVAADLDHLVSDDPAVPGNLGPVANPNAVTEIAWQILQTDTMNPTANELAVSRPLGNGHVSVTRRYEFYKYVGPYDINSPDGPGTGTNEALCASVGADDKHGTGVSGAIDCSTLVVVGEYIGAQNAAANVATPLSANGADLVHGEVGVRYPDRPLIFGGSSGPYSIAFSGAGTLPSADAGNEFALDSLTGVLAGGIPNGTGTSTFTVHATDLVDPSQPAVDATFNLTVVGAVSVDPVALPAGSAGVTSHANLTASGGETPFVWTVLSASAGLGASVVGNTLSLNAAHDGAYSVRVSVDDSLGGTSARTLTFNVGGGPAAVCGNGATEVGEQCDDGAANGTAASCCASTCQFQPSNTACTDDGNVCTADVCSGASALCGHPAGNAGAVCRAAADACDVAETCDGVNGVCPGDGHLPDADADGACDAVDPCTNVGGAQDLLTSPAAKVVLSKINSDTVVGDDKLVLSGALVLPAGKTFADLHPDADGARLLIAAAGGAPGRVDVTLTGGSYLGKGSRGWTLATSGKVWTYQDTTGMPSNGIVKFQLGDASSRTVPNRVKVGITGKGGDYPVVAADAPVEVTVVLGNQADAAAGLCAESGFDAASCTLNRSGNTMTCKK